MAEDRLPHLLFYGPPGTGKTSTILALAKQIYAPREFNSMVLEVRMMLFLTNSSAGNNFSLFTGHLSFQIFLLVGHFTNWTRHNLLTDNISKKVTQDALVRCTVIMYNYHVKLAKHFPNLVGHCPLTNYSIISSTEQ